ncbi:hypothetical protein SESBI_33187 [Sesbania bispinosa]|nr:hypothetical protein SESBI_33187 [Sesbania bispinosa]
MPSPSQSAPSRSSPLFFSYLRCCSTVFCSCCRRRSIASFFPYVCGVCELRSSPISIVSASPVLHRELHRELHRKHRVLHRELLFFNLQALPFQVTMKLFLEIFLNLDIKV